MIFFACLYASTSAFMGAGVISLVGSDAAAATSCRSGE